MNPGLGPQNLRIYNPKEELSKWEEL